VAGRRRVAGLSALASGQSRTRSPPFWRIILGAQNGYNKMLGVTYSKGFVPTKEDAMTTYIMLVNWTDQGIQKIKDSPRRFDVAKQALGDMGGAFKSIFLTMGEYDLIGVYEAPDDAVAARFTMQLGILGNVRTKTLKAFPETAYREIVKSLS
jgi:uncharacterized protein with GYD domain